MRTTGSSASGLPSRVVVPAVPDELVEDPRVAGRAGLVLLLRTGIVVVERRDRVAAEAEPHLLPALVEVAEHAVGGHAEAVEEHEVLATVGDVVAAGRSSMPGDVDAGRGSS